MEDSESKKVVQLLKEMRNESNDEGNKTPLEGNRLNWMYKGGTDLINREEYLLGKSIDKSFEILNNGGNSDLCLGRTCEQSNIPKRLLEKTDNLEQVDIAKKILEDPLYAIKQKELEARKQLLNNPVKLKQIKQMLLERNKKNDCLKKKKKKKLKNSEKLDYKILKILEKFNDNEKKEAFSKIMKPVADDDNDNTFNKLVNEKFNGSKKKKKKIHSSSPDDSESKSTSSKEEPDYYKKSKRKKIEKKHLENKEIGKTHKGSLSDLNNPNISMKKKKHTKKSNNKAEKSRHFKHSKRSRNLSSSSSTNSSSDSWSSSSSGSSSSSSSTDTDTDTDTDRYNDYKKKQIKKKSKSIIKGSHTYNKAEIELVVKQQERISSKNTKEYKSHSVEANKLKKKYGLMVPDNQKPLIKKISSDMKKYVKPLQTKKKYLPPARSKPLTEKERSDKLKEMMKDAKIWKKEREKNIAEHRKVELKEEENKTYDDDFVRKEMSKLTSRGTMADRIKSNMNNIQRSKSSMDSSFVRK